jgi:RNA polymerase sigma factor (TIGR02999 family)
MSIRPLKINSFRTNNARMSDITQLLARAALGETAASNQLMPMIYEQLCTLARRQLGDRPQRHTLSTTDLVHEAYLALFGVTELEWHDRSHFFAYAARTMRNILIDHARRKLANKREGEGNRVDFANISIGIDGESVALLELDRALTQIEAKYPRLVQVVELRFFAGRSVEQTAALLHIDSRAVERDWRKARAMLNLALGNVG